MSDTPPQVVPGAWMVSSVRWSVGCAEFTAAAVFTLIALGFAVAPHLLPDFYIYRLGSELALRGQSPYDLATIRRHVAQQFPDPEPTADSFVNNCGYFLPPQALIVFAPFAVLPWGVAKIAWALLQGAAALAIARVPRLWLAASLVGQPAPIGRWLPFFLLVNFLTLGVAMVGQTTLLTTGCIAAGLWCWSRSTRWGFWPGILLWSVPFIKPHVALPLIAVAWFVGGWKRAAALVGVVVAFNLLGSWLVSDSPRFVRDYLNFLRDSHHAVAFNQAARNYEITSWNRLLFVTTDRLMAQPVVIEQTATITLAAYGVWLGVVLVRCALGGVKPAATWVLAAGVVGSVGCPQVLGYEALVLVLTVPWIRDLFAAGWGGWGTVAALVLGFQALPIQVLAPLGFDFHRPLGVAVLAGVVWVGLLPATDSR
ncbi:MAG: glycosyltransferase 87 family protein [Gemmataceae bacterium]|nr:glycosyltransferase 87 family protein [Gemmata sp.]MDW8196303.1 glycosyltransferase 87 family protein [Gemmataceae bacterium]